MTNIFSQIFAVKIPNMLGPKKLWHSGHYSTNSSVHRLAARIFTTLLLLNGLQSMCAELIEEEEFEILMPNATPLNVSIINISTYAVFSYYIVLWFFPTYNYIHFIEGVYRFHLRPNKFLYFKNTECCSSDNP